MKRNDANLRKGSSTSKIMLGVCDSPRHNRDEELQNVRDGEDAGKDRLFHADACSKSV
jgi:hypothetical protein